MNDISPVNEGERIIKLDGKIDNLNIKFDEVCKSLERVVNALEKLETTRLADHETRIAILESKENERRGMYKIVIFLGVLLSIGIAILTIKSFLK